MTAYLTALSESATREELLAEVARQKERAERAEAQRDAAVEALRKTFRISLPPQRLDDVVFLRETFFSLKSLIDTALSSLDKEGADNAG